MAGRCRLPVVSDGMDAVPHALCVAGLTSAYSYICYNNLKHIKFITEDYQCCLQSDDLDLDRLNCDIRV